MKPSATPLRRTLSTRLLGVALLPLALIGALIAAWVVPEIALETARSNRALARAFAGHVASFLREPADALLATKRTIVSLPRRPDDERNAMLDLLVDVNDLFEAVYVASAEGRVRSVGLPAVRRAYRDDYLGLDMRGKDFFAQAVASGQTVWSDTFLSVVSGQIAVALAVPAGAQVVIGEINLHRLSELIRPSGGVEGQIALIVDRRGQVVAHPDPLKGTQQLNLSNVMPIHAWLSGEEHAGRFELDGTEMLGTLVALERPSWALLVAQPASAAEHAVASIRLILVVGGVVAFLLAALAAMVTVRRLSAPIEAFVDHARAVSGGRYDDLPPASAISEFMQLGESLSHMGASIRDRERLLAESEAKYRELVQGTEDLIFRVGRDGRFSFVNDSSSRILGHSPIDCTGRPALEFIHPEDRPFWSGKLASCLAEPGTHGAIEVRVVCVEGGQCHMLISLQSHTDPTGQISEVSGIGRDISQRKRAEDALRRSEEHVRLLMNSTGEGLFGVDTSGKCTFINPAGLGILGYEDASELLGQPIHELIHHSRPDGSRYPIEECRLHIACRENRPSVVDEEVFWRKDGAPVRVQYSGHPILSDGRIVGAVCNFHDITARLETEEKLRLAAKVLESTAEGIIITDAAGRIIAANPAASLITGYRQHELLGQSPSLLRSGRHDDAFYAAMWESLASSGHWSGELWNRNRKGEVYPEWLTINAVRDASGKPTHYVGVFSDITSMKRSQAQLEFIAHHDPLTGLPNRLLFADRLEHSIHRARREAAQLAVVFVDLDHFKNVNDTLGHQLGDELLGSVARALAEEVRAGDTLARLGGDEFVVLLEDIQGPRDATVVADKLLKVLARPFDVDGNELYIGASIGISLYPADGEDASTLVRNADAAMYQVKSQGRNGYRFYASEMTDAAAERLKIEAMLRRSLDNGEILAYYQPQVDLASGTLVGMEALVRWSHPELGFVSPARFIPIAEDIGMIHLLGEWVLHRACRQLVEWDEAGLEIPSISVNVSAKQLTRGNLPDKVAGILGETRLEASRLKLELTESVITAGDETLRTMDELRSLGVVLAVDDFGTGYSSMSYLKRLPIRELKIDRSFVQDIPADANDVAITRAIIGLAGSLGLSVIAEGVETRAQADFLLASGCAQAQGFLFGRPAEPAEILRRWGPARQMRASG